MVLHIYSIPREESEAAPCGVVGLALDLDDAAALELVLHLTSVLGGCHFSQDVLHIIGSLSS